MFITRKSISSGKVRSIDIPITLEQLKLYESGVPLEKAAPKLRPIAREFVISGMTRSEWVQEFGSDEGMGITPISQESP